MIRFFKRPIMKSLIDYITVMPESEEDTTFEQGHKFPFVVNELFSTENQALIEKFFEEEVSEGSEPAEPDAEDGEVRVDSDDEVKNESEGEDNEGEQKEGNEGEEESEDKPVEEAEQTPKEES